MAASAQTERTFWQRRAGLWYLWMLSCCDLVQLGSELDADDLAERIVRGDQQDASLTGSEVDETEAAEVLVEVEQQRVDEQAR